MIYRSLWLFRNISTAYSNNVASVVRLIRLEKSLFNEQVYVEPSLIIVISPLFKIRLGIFYFNLSSKIFILQRHIWFSFDSSNWQLLYANCVYSSEIT